MSSQLENEAAFESGPVGFVYRQWMIKPKPVPPGTDLTGQVAVVTGANSGLGFETGRQLLQLGLSHLILTARSQVKGDNAAEILRKQHPKAEVSVWLLDMESYDSIAAFARKCETLPSINSVILNAGLQNDNFTTSKPTGHEVTFQVNYLSTVLLTILLLPVLKSRRTTQSQPTVLTIVTSDTAYWARLEPQGSVLAQFDRSEGYSAGTVYMQTKLLQQLFVRELASKVDADDVIINMVSPGLCAGTNFGGGTKGWSIGSVLFALLKATLSRPVEAGAGTYVDAAVIKGKDSHGSYVADWAIRPYPSMMYNEEGKAFQARLWEETMEELNFAGASRIVQTMRHA
ncbi:retinol dehydrogenase 12 [Xylariaceae sp. FL0016]|nr:retinol dehydrogenase 12 [Xylariaceae sp. FL0016]